jgi:hypothetical protein
MVSSDIHPANEAAPSSFKVALRSETVAPAKVLVGKDGSQIITVPARVLRLVALTNLCESLIQVLCAATLNEIDDFEIHAGLHLDSNKMCRAIVTASCEYIADYKAAENAVLYYFQCIRNGDKSKADLLGTGQNQLALETTKVVQELANGLLQKVGGSAISYPASVYVNEQQLAEFSGTFAPRPDINNIQSLLNVSAQFDGYRHKLRTVFLLTKEGESIRANWSEESDFSRVLALANDENKLLQLSLSVTQDQRGQPVYTLVF